MEKHKVTVYNTEFVNGKPTLVKEQSVKRKGSKHYDETKKVLDLLCDVFHADQLTEESLFLVCMDAKLCVRGLFCVAKGTVCGLSTGMREIYMRVLLTGCNNIVVCHNHPSGDPTPSNQDISLTQSMQNAACLMGINLLDHLIIGTKEDFYSFKHNGNVL